MRRSSPEQGLSAHPPGLLVTDHQLGGWGSERDSDRRLLSSNGRNNLLSTRGMLSTDASGIYSTGAMSTSDYEAPMLRAGKRRSDYE